MSAFSSFLSRIRAEGTKRPETVRVKAMGRARVFEAFDLGDDTFVVEKGVAVHLGERPSALIVRKDALRRRAKGRVMTFSTGNHAVAAFPLLDGRFWNLSSLPSARRSAILARDVLCANVVQDKLEISQREVPTEVLAASDAWLQETAGLSMSDVVMIERNDRTLEHYRRCGQEWRVKPLAWTEREMRTALAAARKRIATSVTYYHSSRGVHFLTFPEFVRLAALAETNLLAFVKGLRELVSVYEGNGASFVRMEKFRGHHEVEFFGLGRGVVQSQLVPELEKLMEAIELRRVGHLGVIQRIQEVVALYRSRLTHPDLAVAASKLFAETLYMHITGEVYSVAGEGTTPAFDDRRTALPGATFVDGRQVPHPGADARTERLLANLRGLMSKDEIIEYANVYELRADENSGSLGSGATREVAYKTNRRPLESSLVEKRLSSTREGYGAYVLARIGALRALGASLSDFYIILKRRPGSGRGEHDYYIRRRCEGEPMNAIPANYFRSAVDPSLEDRSFILSLAALMGDAAAQNMAMKRYDPKTQTPLYGVGKEIYEFEHDIARNRMVPKKVSTCSVRGSFGWPKLEETDANFDAVAAFYLGHFARAVRNYQRRHPIVTVREVAERFMDGFAFRTQAMAWRLSTLRDRFEGFRTPMPPRFGFARKWRFVMWSLAQQDSRLPQLRERFVELAFESEA